MKLVIFLLLISCKITQVTNKVADIKTPPISAETEDVIPEKTQIESDNSNKFKIDPNNINLPALVSDPVRVAVARVLYDRFVERIKETAKTSIPDIEMVDFESIFAKLITACSSVKSKKFSDIVDELDPLVLKILEEDDVLKKELNMTLILEKKNSLLLIVKLLGPSVLERGIGSINPDSIIEPLLN